MGFRLTMNGLFPVVRLLFVTDSLLVWAPKVLFLDKDYTFDGLSH